MIGQCSEGNGVREDRNNTGILMFSLERRARNDGMRELALTVSSNVIEMSPLLRSKVKLSNSGGRSSSIYTDTLLAPETGMLVRLLSFISSTVVSASDM